MSRVSTYLNFDGTAEEAFGYYASVFGTEPVGDIIRMGDMPPGPGVAELSDDDKKLVMHIEMPILAGHALMATDIVPSMGQELRIGNNTTINVEPDTRDEADRLYAALSDGGSDSTAMQEMPWGYWGCTLDRYGIRWMFNVMNSTA
jgi:PhnB protein